MLIGVTLVNLGVAEDSLLFANLFSFFINDLQLETLRGEIIVLADHIAFLISSDGWVIIIKVDCLLKSLL